MYEQDKKYMHRALQLALRGQYTTRPNPLVGAVLVKNNQIIGEGAHLQAGEPHAEIYALKQAGENAKGSTCYVTLEPCSHWGRTGPCVDALIQAGVARVVFSMRDPNPKVHYQNQGIERLKAAGILVEQGLFEAESRALNPGFISYMERRRPYVRAKIAASLDGKTALSNGQSQWITGKAARQDVQYLRARSSVIITGWGTIKLDNPSLNIRQKDWPENCLLDKSLAIKQPARIICDSKYQSSKDLKIYETETQEGKIWIAHANFYKKSEPQGIYLPNQNNQVDLFKLLDWCYEQNFTDVLIEAGNILTGAWVQSGLIDEYWIYLAPCFLGSGARDMLKIPALEDLNQAKRFSLQSSELIGQDLRLIVK